MVYCYPMTGRPGTPLPEGWDGIPGARGCTPESCGFRDRHAELTALGARLFGMSTQSTDYQREAKERLGLPFELLSDEGLGFCRAIGLPTFEVEGMVLVKRLTLVVRDGGIEHVFYPVFPRTPTRRRSWAGCGGAGRLGRGSDERSGAQDPGARGDRGAPR